jgi:Flp pilus assembly protein TadB
MVGVIGLLVAVAGFRGLLPRLDQRGPVGDVGQLPLRLVLGAGGFAGLLVLTGWPIAAAYGALGGMLLPTLRSAKRQRREVIERVEAIAVWAESLRDTMAASAGIQEAIRTSARVAPAPIRTEVRNLALRLQHQPVQQALRRFAAELAHPLSDMVVASLILAATRQAGSLQGVLAVTAKAARDSATMWRQIEGRRARIYSQARLAGWVSALMILFLILFRRSFLEPYDGLGGQIALVFIGGIFLVSGITLYALSQPSNPRRVFKAIETWAPSSPRTLGMRP